jgi:lincosamide nucleotidyltransferase A/C/D/E
MMGEDVVEVLSALDAGGIEYWVDGGWGIDALMGEQTRPHRDLDLGIRIDDVAKVEAALPQFHRESEEEWPRFLLLADDGDRIVDLLLVDVSASGQFRQRLAEGGELYIDARDTCARGSIGGRSVRCASLALQRLRHQHPDASGQGRFDIEVVERMRSRYAPASLIDPPTPERPD